MQTKKSSRCRVLTYLFTVLAFASTVLSAVLGALSGTTTGGFFNNSVGNISDKYSVELTPSSFVFGTIWPLIFLWTIIGKFYLVISLFLPVDKSPVKINPAPTPLGYLIFDTCAFADTIAWYFAWDAESLGWSYALLIFTVFDAYSAVGITLKRVADNAATYEKNNKVTLWLVRILVQNGLCVFATWVTIASMVGLTILLVYVDSPGLPVATERGLISNANASSVSAGILIGLVILWFVLENFVLEKYLRYIFTIYPVLIFAFAGVIYKLTNDAGSRQNIIFASVNLSICSVLFLARIGLSIYRFVTRSTSASQWNSEKEGLTI